MYHTSLYVTAFSDLKAARTTHCRCAGLRLAHACRRRRDAHMADDEKECRICRGDAESERPLFHPCKCSGSIKYTHEDCLIKWLSESGSSQCELCHHPFRFEPLYQPDTPQLLPTREFVVGIAARIRRACRTAARIALVFIVWLFFLPVATCWTWYGLFINSPTQLPLLVFSRGVPGLITDAFRGCLLSIAIVFVFLGVSSLREYVRHIPDEDLDHPADAAFDDQLVRDLAIHDDHQPFAQHRAAGDPDAHPGPAANVAPPTEELFVDHSTDDAVEVPGLEEWDDLLRDTYAIPHEDEDDDPEPPVHQFNEADGTRNAEEDRLVERINDLDGAIIDEIDGRDNASDSQTSSDTEVLEEFPEFHVPLMDEQDPVVDVDDNFQGDAGALFGLFELDPEEVPLEEVVGLRGHLRNLFDHAGTVLVSNALFLGIFTFIPLCIGRLTLRLLSFRSFPIPASFGLDASAAALPRLNASLAAAGNAVNATEGEISRVVGNVFNTWTTTWSSNTTFSANVASFAAAVASDFRGLLTSMQSTTAEEPLVSYADNLLVVLLGYGVVSLGAVSYVIINSLLRSRYPTFDSPMTRHIAGMLRYIATIMKILVLILFEFGIFPLGCGWWLDICMLDLVGANLESRLVFCRLVPWLCTAGHWFLGIVFMVNISLFVSLLREVLRPELLWFLRNPDDPDFHPFRELVEKPLSRHARRMCLSVLIYVPLVMATVFVPSKICVYMLPHVFPLRFDDFSHSLIDVPFGNLLVVPLVSLVHHTRPGIILQKALQVWIDLVGSALGIVHLVAKENEDDQRRQFAAQQPAVQVAQRQQGAPLLRMPQNANPAWEDADDQDYENDDEFDTEFDTKPTDVRPRAIIMFLLAWGTLVIFECFFLSAPTMLGRHLMKLIGLSVYHDLHSFGCGFYVLLMSIQVVTHLKTFLANVDGTTLLRTAIPRAVQAIKSATVVVLWLGIVPLTAGVLLELTITVPLRVPHNETPYLYLHQDWALGLLIMKLWNKVVLAGRLNIDWRERVERAREGGFLGLGPNLPRTLQEVVLPVLGWTLVALSVPYAFSHGLLPLLGCSSLLTNIIYRFSYIGIAVFYFSQLFLRSLYHALRGLHDSIRDDRYLIGRRLYNFSERNARVSATPRQ